VPERSIRLAVHYCQGSFPVWKLGPLVDDNLGAALTDRLADELGPGYHVTFAGNQTPVQFFAIVDIEDGRLPERPAGLLRRTHTRPVATDQALHKDLQWHPTDYLRLDALGHHDRDLVEITEEQAQAVIADWRQLYSDPRRLVSVILTSPRPGQPAAFKVDGCRYPSTAAARAAVEEATSLLQHRRLAFEVATDPTDPTDPLPAVPSWETVRKLFGWQQPADQGQGTGRR
jgi:hypothetical protein